MPQISTKPILDIKGRLYTIAPHRPFAASLARGLLRRAKRLGRMRACDPALIVARSRIYLPTRQACDHLKSVFASILPAPDKPPILSAMADIDEEPIDISRDHFPDIRDTTIPKAVTRIERVTHLTALLMRERAIEVDAALRLGEELARLFDQFRIERKDIETLNDIKIEEHGDRWHQILSIVLPVYRQWQKILTDSHRCEAIERSNRILDAQGAFWRDSRKNGRSHEDIVIVAGTTGSRVATRDFIKEVLQLPMGWLILPGFDPAMARIGKDDRAMMAWTHHQDAMVRLLEELSNRQSAEKSDTRNWLVKDWHDGDMPSRHRERRVALVRDLLAPFPKRASLQWPLENGENGKNGKTATGKADRGKRDAALAPAAQEGLRLFQCRHEGEEARVIGALLRQSHDNGERAALVTANRALARRVISHMRQWNLDVNDSAGNSLSRSSIMIFLRLLAKLITDGWMPVDLLTIVKHPLIRPFAGGVADPINGPIESIPKESPPKKEILKKDMTGHGHMGVEKDHFKESVAILEREILRGLRPPSGIAGWRAKIDRWAGKDTTNTTADQARSMHALLNHLDTATAAFARLLHSSKKVSPAEIIKAHYAAGQALIGNAHGHSEAADRNADMDDDAAIAHRFFQRAGAACAHLPAISGYQYPNLLDHLCRDERGRSPHAADGRVFIWGRLQARLHDVDRIILGGLNEGLWPPSTGHDTWINRKLCRDIGLRPPEWRIGAAGHDFIQAMGMKDVVLTRSRYQEGRPTQASRWLVRMQYLVPGIEKDADMDKDDLLSTESPPPLAPMARPGPSPRAELRPKSFYVSHIEQLIRDPYRYYVRHILQVRPRPPLDEEPDHRLFGQIIHSVLARFVHSYPTVVPDDAIAILMTMTQEELRVLNGPGLVDIWQWRMRAIFKAFLIWQRERQENGITTEATEVKGQYCHRRENPTGGADKNADIAWCLKARADRIDDHPDQGRSIIDYKTGTAPEKDDVLSGLYPQLMLEGIIATYGEYNGGQCDKLPKRPLSGLYYLKLSPKKEKPKPLSISLANDIGNCSFGAKGSIVSHDEMARKMDNVMVNLNRFLTDFLDPSTPLLCRPRPGLTKKTQGRDGAFDPLDHLCRFQEWESRPPKGSARPQNLLHHATDGKGDDEKNPDKRGA